MVMFLLVAVPVAATLGYLATHLDAVRMELRDRARLSDVKDIEGALNFYARTNKVFPQSGDFKALTGEDEVSSTLEGDLAIADVPRDPLHPAMSYVYQSKDGRRYTLRFCLEKDRGAYKAGCENTIIGELPN